jgi:hypothetical protein
LPARERRQDGLREVILARGGEQHRFRAGAKRLGSATEQDVADRLRAGRAARLARHQRFEAERLQPAGEPRDLRRLAGPLPALKRDETPAPHFATPHADGLGRLQRAMAISPSKIERRVWRGNAARRISGRRLRQKRRLANLCCRCEERQRRSNPIFWA